MIDYRTLSPEDITPDLLAHFVRRQEVSGCWRKRDGCWQIEPIVFVDDWSEEDKHFVIHCLREILTTGGGVMGAYCAGQLKGLAAVDAALLGSRGQYRELSGFWVSADYRGRGIGRQLFTMAKNFARSLGGEKLFVCSHSSVQTQAFYKAMGCREAEEYSAPHAQREPFDCQIECAL